eukprot:GDKJ01021876.1.p1 GENE.GDKJ01021876.1~~GDKJ01021876.1.p1  ORF type:complete len:203 (+),score=27.31 GDKJ01021876.1:29-637(+)
MGSRARDYDHSFKFVIIGDTGVGKSCLLVRFADDAFQQSYLPTIGVDFRYRTLRVGDKSVKLQIWDTAGQERFKTITNAYYRGADGIVIVYDTTDRESFDNLESWYNEVNQYVKPTTKKILVGNKCDLDFDRKIPKEEAAAKAEELGMKFLEVSAKDATGVEEAFASLAAQILNELPAADDRQNASLSLSTGGLSSYTQGCC